jgi:hypothetical protein
MVFRNRKGNHLNRKWNYFTSLTKGCPFGPMIPNGFQEQEMELTENKTLKRCSPSQPSAQICACFQM